MHCLMNMCWSYLRLRCIHLLVVWPLPPPVVAGSGSKLTLFEDYWSTAVLFGTYSSCPSANLEIDRYLADPLVAPDNNFDVLKWWKDNDLRYPVIARIARDVLTILIFNVSSESAFSTGGRVLDPFRSSLAPATVEALICTKDWLRRADENEPINIKETLDCIESYDMDSEMASNSTATSELGTSTTAKT